MGLCMKKREAYCTRKSVGVFGVGFQITHVHASHMLYKGLQLAAEELLKTLQILLFKFF